MNDMANLQRSLNSLIVSNLNLEPEEIKEWVVENYYVDDVYSTDVLNQWALDNGYTKTNNNE
jgi:hypothetical protein